MYLFEKYLYFYVNLIFMTHLYDIHDMCAIKTRYITKTSAMDSKKNLEIRTKKARKLTWHSFPIGSLYGLV